MIWFRLPDRLCRFCLLSLAAYPRLSGDEEGDGRNLKSGAEAGDLNVLWPNLAAANCLSWPIKLFSAGESSSLLEASSNVDESPLCRAESAIETRRSGLTSIGCEASLLLGLGLPWPATELEVLIELPGFVTVTALGIPSLATIGL